MGLFNSTTILYFYLVFESSLLLLSEWRLLWHLINSNSLSVLESMHTSSGMPHSLLYKSSTYCATEDITFVGKLLIPLSPCPLSRTFPVDFLTSSVTGSSYTIVITFFFVLLISGYLFRVSFVSSPNKNMKSLIILFRLSFMSFRFNLLSMLSKVSTSWYLILIMFLISFVFNPFLFYVMLMWDVCRR